MGFESSKRRLIGVARACRADPKKHRLAHLGSRAFSLLPHALSLDDLVSATLYRGVESPILTGFEATMPVVGFLGSGIGVAMGGAALSHALEAREHMADGGASRRQRCFTMGGVRLARPLRGWWRPGGGTTISSAVQNWHAAHVHSAGGTDTVTVCAAVVEPHG